jgi:hypothetical protein
MKDITVKIITEPPAIGKVQMQQGIRTEEGARNWAARNGYRTVYFYKRRERVYADKTEKNQPVQLSIIPDQDTAKIAGVMTSNAS